MSFLLILIPPTYQLPVSNSISVRKHFCYAILGYATIHTLTASLSVAFSTHTLMADSQPLDEFTIEKVHHKSWAQSMQIGMRNKVDTTMTMSFHYPETGEVRSMTFTPSFACMKEVHASIPVDDDDKVMEFNEYHLDYKTAVEQKIQNRKAKSAQHKVCESVSKTLVD